MALAWLLTALAICGMTAGVFWGHAVKLSHHLSAAGGGLLFGISIFWVVPEMAETTGLPTALLLVVLVGSLLTVLDRVLFRNGHGGHIHSTHTEFLWTILLATAVHSTLDGWSIRLLGQAPITNAAVTIGLALHKIPEGLAVGWISRRALSSIGRALVAGILAELFTVVGALGEPVLNATGSAHFGPWWVTSVLSIIAGGFMFLGLHAVMPAWRSQNRKVVATFLTTLLLVAALTLVHSAKI